MDLSVTNAREPTAYERALEFAQTIIGHNSAIEYYARVGALEDRLAALPMPISNTADAEILRDLIADAHKAWGEFEEDRKKAQEPHQLALDNVRTAFRPIVERAEAVKLKGKVPLNAWIEAERLRLQQEAAAAEAKRIALEQEALAAQRAAAQASGFGDEQEDADDLAKDAAEAQVMADHAARIAASGPKVSSALGIARAAGQRTTWSARVIDPVAMVKALASNPDVQAAALKIANAQMRATKGTAVIKGVEAVEVRSV